MRHKLAEWRRDRQLWIEAFALFNFAGLVLDVYLAHSQNRFRRDAEYLPLYFSTAAAVSLAIVVPLRSRLPAVWRDVGHLIGWLAVLIGVGGVILHLDSQFFEARTIRSLTYAAPFAAPLAFTGLGLLLIANRLVDPATADWGRWVLLLALGGFAGNFVFSLTDHAQNAFFSPIEWVPVVASACAIGFLLVPFAIDVSPSYLKLCAGILILQVFVGLVGFGFHAAADLRQPGATFFEQVLSGAPLLAPMLFPNLALLALVGLVSLEPTDGFKPSRTPSRSPERAD